MREREEQGRRERGKREGGGKEGGKTTKKTELRRARKKERHEMAKDDEFANSPPVLSNQHGA